MTTNFEDLINSGESWDTYTPPSDVVPQPDAGVYKLVRNTDEGSFRAGISGDGVNVWYMPKLQLTGTDKFDGRFVSAVISTKVSEFSGTSTVEDYASSAGAIGKQLKSRPSVAGLLAEARHHTAMFPDNPPYLLEKIVGPFTARIDWEFRCRDCEHTFLQGQKNPKAPKNYSGPKAIVAKGADGKTALTQNCPTCNASVGAALVVRKFLTPKAGAAAVAAQTAVANEQGA